MRFTVRQIMTTRLVTIEANASIDDVFACLVRELLAGPLRAKRCAQVEHCDEATCAYRAAGTCDWARLAERLARG